MGHQNKEKRYREWEKLCTPMAPSPWIPTSRGLCAPFQGSISPPQGCPPPTPLKMAEKLVAGDLFLRQARESVSSLDSDKLSPVSPEAGGEESSDSEGEQEGSTHKLIRKVSTSGQMRSKVRGPPPPVSPDPKSSFYFLPAVVTGWQLVCGVTVW